ncbi:alpha/beta hydrolase [Novosphingobium fuchskuhlense]|uniref:Alpha/beta hydrolase n=1 Tax=Novosphingobium fuchskuhlense TaxID=1117702 RepID=A0A117UXY9_9SPHN|nr:alpha/beta hydrolase [Novosphingobium fuchskuhlense]KUR72926.1 alpha/beta hydrolase [Novosphingobium fuchskuhlense]
MAEALKSGEKRWQDRSWTSSDGLKLHFRDYAQAGTGSRGRPPILCLHGLTRNARDFEAVAERLAGDWRVLCPDMRGRGDSDYARDPMTYTPAHYVADVEALLAAEGIERFVVIGTSLGGLMTMMLAAVNPERITAAVINDVGPVIEPAGLARIREYVGQGRSYETWVHAARALQEANREIYPAWQLPDWLRMAKRCMVIGTGGRIVFDYDMKIAEPFETEHGPAPEPAIMWGMYEAVARRPLLVLRGAHSDILSAEVAARMNVRGSATELVTVPGVGHAPTLDEDEAVAAIDRLLARAV